MHAGISLVVVSGDSELTEGETVEMECAAGVLDANSILVLFRFNERVMAYCRPFQSVPKVYHKSWTIYHRNDSSSNCVLGIAAVKASDSGQYTCEGFLPADHLALTSNTITMTVMEDPSNTYRNNSRTISGSCHCISSVHSVNCTCCSL